MLESLPASQPSPFLLLVFFLSAIRPAHYCCHRLTKKGGPRRRASPLSLLPSRDAQALLVSCTLGTIQRFQEEVGLGLDISRCPALWVHPKWSWGEAWGSVGQIMSIPFTASNLSCTFSPVRAADLSQDGSHMRQKGLFYSMHTPMSSQGVVAAEPGILQVLDR